MLGSVPRLEEALAQDLIQFVSRQLRAAADPVKARGMAAYMKTDMPFYGVQKPQRAIIAREIQRRFPINTRQDYRAAVLALWTQLHREEKYLALSVARLWPDFIDCQSLPLYRQLIIDGAWWDFVDEVATQIIGAILVDERERALAVMDRWIGDRNMWVRRAAILSQIKSRNETDPDRLFADCRRCAPEGEFFIRKAIGWALREYAKSNPRAVKQLLIVNRKLLSTLSFREAGTHLKIPTSQRGRMN